MAGEATGAFEEQMRPLLKRTEESVREIQRVERRLEALLETEIVAQLSPETYARELKMSALTLDVAAILSTVQRIRGAKPVRQFSEAPDHALAGRIERAMVIAKGSLFLGKMTQLSDGMSFVLEAS